MKTFNRNLRPIDNFMQAFQVSNDAVFHPREHRTAQTKTSLFQRSVMWLGLILALVVGSGGEVWGQTYDLVTTTDELENGAEYIIAGTTSNEKLWILSTTQQNNNRAALQNGTASSMPATLEYAAGFASIIFEESNGKWTLYDGDPTGSGTATGGTANGVGGNEGYLYPVNGQNYLRTQEETHEWSVSINGTTSAATIQTDVNDRVIQLNNVGDLFSAYTGTQRSIYLYKKRSGEPTPEPSNYPTAFSCGTSGLYSMPLSWTASDGDVEPIGYLVKWSEDNDITDPVDGVADNGTHSALVIGTSYSVNGLVPGTTYYFKIWPYTNIGSEIDYKTDGEAPAISCETAEGPCVSEGFDDMPDNNSSYSTRQWEGAGGVWNATSARTDQTLNGRAICTNNSGSITSPGSSTGMGVLSFKYVRGFTGTGTRTIKVFVNGDQIGGDIAVPTNSDEVSYYSHEINISGNVQLELQTSGAQIIIDDIEWTCYSEAPVESPDYSITTSGGSVTIEDLVGGDDELEIVPTAVPGQVQVNLAGTGKKWTDGNDIYDFPAIVALPSNSLFFINTGDGDDDIHFSRSNGYDFENMSYTSVLGGSGINRVFIEASMTFIENHYLQIGQPGFEPQINSVYIHHLNMEGNETRTLSFTGVNAYLGLYIDERIVVGNIEDGVRSEIQVDNGWIDMIVYQSAAEFEGGDDGITLENAAVVATGSGFIYLSGIAGRGVNGRNGVSILAGSTVTTNTGQITINGNAADDDGEPLISCGILIEGDGTVISKTGGGSILLSGTAGKHDPVSGFSYGVCVLDGATVQGSASTMGSVSINGYGGYYGNAVGILVQDASVLSLGKDISLTGYAMGGVDGTANNYGISLVDAVVSNAGSGKITLAGYGSVLSNGGHNYGVNLIGTTHVSLEDGRLDIQGSGGGSPTSSGHNNGIYIDGSVNVTGDGELSINGIGGHGSGSNHGLVLDSHASVDVYPGRIYMTGSGGTGNSAANHGTVLTENVNIHATNGPGNISLNGTAGTGNTGIHYGLVIGQGCQITHDNGDISLNGHVSGSGAQRGISMVSTGGDDIEVSSENADVFLRGNSMHLDMNAGGIFAGGGIYVQVLDDDIPVEIGDSPDVHDKLVLSESELHVFEAYQGLTVGVEIAGDLVVTSPITYNSETTLTLLSGGDIIFADGGFNMTNEAILNVNPGVDGAFYPNYTGTDFTGDLLMIHGSLALHINGVDPGSGTGSTYSRLDIDGYIDLDDVELQLINAGDYEPTPGDEFTLVKNLLGDDNQNYGNISGTFSGLPDFATIPEIFGAEGIEGLLRYNAGLYSKDAVLLLREPCVSAEGVPTDLEAYVASGTEAHLYWQPVGNETSWDIKYGVPGFDPETEGVLVEDYTGSLPYILEFLEEGDAYAFVVRANCGEEKGPWSAPFEWAMLLCEAPAEISHTNVTSISAVIQWTEVDGVDSYEVEWRLHDDPEVGGTALSFTNQYIVLTLLPDSEYEYRVRSICDEETTSEWQYSSDMIMTLPGVSGDYVWNGGEGEWSNPDSWDPVGIPSANDVAYIHDGVVTIDMANLQLNTLNLLGGEVYAVNEEQEITLENFNLYGGIMEAGGPVNVVNGTLYWEGGTLSGPISQPKTKWELGYLTKATSNTSYLNYKDIELIGAFGHFEGDIELSNGATLTFREWTGHNSEGLTGAIRAGEGESYYKLEPTTSFVKYSPGVFTIEPTFLNYGGMALDANSTLKLAQKENTVSIHAGYCNVNSGSTLELVSGYHVFGDTDENKFALPSGDGNLLIQENAWMKVALSMNNSFTITNRGVVELDAASFIGCDGLFNNDGGTIKGSGVYYFTGGLNQSGIISPGMSPGCMEINGDVDNTNGTLLIELGGETQCDEYDHLQVNGVFTAGGILQVVFVNGFIPEIDDEFVFLTASDGIEPSSFFEDYELVGGDDAWSVTRDANEYKLRFLGMTEPVVAYSYILDEDNNLVITDLLGNDDLFGFASEDGNIISGVFIGDGTHYIDENDVIHEFPAIHDPSTLSSITINTGGGDDLIYIPNAGAPIENMPSLTLLGGEGVNQLFLLSPITFAENASLTVGQSADDPQFHLVSIGDIINQEDPIAYTFTGTGGATIYADNVVQFGEGYTDPSNYARILLQTEDGDIVIESHHQSSVDIFPNFIGISLYNTTITSTGSGDILLRGRGGYGDLFSGEQIGVRVKDGSEITSHTGDITLHGFGGGIESPDLNHGVAIEGEGTVVRTTGNGNITLIGEGGGQGSSILNMGVYIGSGGSIVGGSSGTVSITGTGGASEGAQSGGVQILESALAISTTGADIVINATGGASDLGSGIGNGGFAMVESSIMAGGSGNITITGTGATNGDGQQILGVLVARFSPGPDMGIFTESGDIHITGYGGGTMGSYGTNFGILTNSVMIASTNGGSITLEGYGGNGIQGDALFQSPGILSLATRFETNGGDINLIGSAGADHGSQHVGVRLSLGTQVVTTGETGNILVHGVGSQGTGEESMGVSINQGSRIETEGGHITIIGEEGVHETSVGIHIGDPSSKVSSEDGTIALIANSMNIYDDIEGVISTNSSITVHPFDEMTEIHLGETNDELGGPLSLSIDELNTFVAGQTLYIGDASATSQVVVTQPLAIAATNAIEIVSGGNIRFGEGNITMVEGGSVVLTPGVEDGGIYPNFLGSEVIGDVTVNGRMVFELRGIDQGTGEAGTYSNFSVNGSINIDGQEIVIVSEPDFNPNEFVQFNIISNFNDDNGVEGTLAGLPEGTIIPDFLGNGWASARVTYEAGGSGKDVALIVTFQCEAPTEAPTDLSASMALGELVHLMWEYSGSAPEWDIVYGLSGIDLETNGTLVRTAFRPYSFDNLIAGYTYVFMVRAVCDDEVGPWSDPYEFSPCYTPSEATFTSIGYTYAAAEWDAIPGTTSYKVEWWVENVWEFVEASTPTNQYVLYPLGPETEYTYHLKSVCGDVESEWSDEWKFTTAPASYTNYEWQSGDNNWSASNEWFPVGVPGAMDLAVVHDGTVHINHPDLEVFYLEINGGAIRSEDENQEIHIGTLMMDGGLLESAGPTNIITDIASITAGTIAAPLSAPVRTWKFDNAFTKNGSGTLTFDHVEVDLGLYAGTLNHLDGNIELSNGAALLAPGYNALVANSPHMTGILAGEGESQLILGDLTSLSRDVEGTYQIKVPVTMLNTFINLTENGSLLYDPGDMTNSVHQAYISIAEGSSVEIASGHHDIGIQSNPVSPVIGGDGEFIISGGSVGIRKDVTAEVPFILQGAMMVDADVTATFTKPFTNNGGMLGGHGTFAFEGTFDQSGTLSPGTSPGCMHIIGDVDNTSGTIFIEIGGYTVCDEYDQLNISGTFTMGGNLDINLINGFEPEVDDEFVIITATEGIESGSFNLMGSSDWIVVFDENEIKLRYLGNQPLAIRYSVIDDGDNNLLITDIVDLGDFLIITMEEPGVLNISTDNVGVSGWTDGENEYPLPILIELDQYNSITINTAGGVLDYIIFGEGNAPFENLPSINLLGGSGINLALIGTSMSFNQDANLVIGKPDGDPEFHHISHTGDEFGADIHLTFSGSGSVSMYANNSVTLGYHDFNIVGSIVTEDGDITLEAYKYTDLSGLDDFVGVSLEGVLLETTGSGNIIINGKGNPIADGLPGVRIVEGSEIITQTGNIDIIGEGNQVTTGTGNHGILVHGNTTRIATEIGRITLNGTGGGAEGAEGLNQGIRIVDAEIIANAGGAIELVGTGGNGTADDRSLPSSGIHVYGAQITAIDGDIDIYGTGGDNNGAYNTGVLLEEGIIYASGNGIINVQGTGGQGLGSDNFGVVLNSGARIESEDGIISISGIQGNGPSGLGILMDDGVDNNQTGVISANGNINLWANSMELLPDVYGVQAVTGSVFVRAAWAGVGINPGLASKPSFGPLYLTSDELNKIQAGEGLYIGDPMDGGPITVSADIEYTGSDKLTLRSNYDIQLDQGGITMVDGGTVILTPGESPGNMYPYYAGTDVTGDLIMNNNVRITMNGTTPGYPTETTYTQLTVDGDVDLTNASLEVITHTDFVPEAGQSFMVVELVDEEKSITGNFIGLPEGSELNDILGSGLKAIITYVGGDGNDVVLSVVDDPCDGLTPFVLCPLNLVVCELDAPFALTGGWPEGGVYSGDGVSGGIFDPSQAQIGPNIITFTYTDSETLCAGSCQFEVVVVSSDSCSTESLMEWVLLEPDTPSCDGPEYATDCETGRVCYGLEYTPSYTGDLTSYSAFFNVNCVTGAVPSYNASCVLDDVSLMFDACPGDKAYFLASGIDNIAPYAVTSGQPVIIHKVCFDLVPDEDPVIVQKDDLGMEASITIENGYVTDYPAYNTLTIDLTPTVICPLNLVACFLDAPFALTGGWPEGGVFSGDAVIDGIFYPSMAQVGVNIVTYTYSDPTAICPGTCTFEVEVIAPENCSEASSMTWVMLQPDEVACGGPEYVTDCETGRVCYGLEYTPGYTGDLTNYTAAFNVNCVSGAIPVYNASCVLDDVSDAFDACPGDKAYFLVSGVDNIAAFPVTASQPVIIHKVCFDLDASDPPMTIEVDDIYGMETGISITNGFVTDFPTYEAITVDLFPELSFTVNGQSAVNVNNGSVDATEDVTVDVCDVPNNLSISTIVSSLSGHTGVTVTFNSTNISSPPMGTMSGTLDEVNDALVGVNTIRLLDHTAVGSQTITIVSFNDLNNDGIMDEFECAGDVITLTIVVHPLPEISFTINGENAGNIINGEVDDIEDVSITVCDGPGNLSISPVTSLVDDNVSLYVTFVSDNISSPPAGPLSGLIDDVNDVLANVNTIRLLDHGQPGSQVITIMPFIDVNNNGEPDGDECQGEAIVVTINVSTEAFVNAGPDQAICFDGTVQLAGSITGGVTTGTWSGGTGTFEPNANALDAVYVPSAGDIAAGFVVLTLTSDDPDGIGPCSPQSDEVTIVINPQPNVSFDINDVELLVPQLGNDQEFCFDVNDINIQLSSTGVVVGTTPFTVSFTINGGDEQTIDFYEENFYNLVDYLPANGPYVEAGTYMIQVTSIVDANGCAISEAVLDEYYYFQVIIHPMPNPMLTLNGEPLLPYSDFAFCEDVATIEIELHEELSGNPTIGDEPFTFGYVVYKYDGLGDSTEVLAVTNTGQMFGQTDDLKARLVAELGAANLPGSYVLHTTEVTDANGCQIPASVLADYYWFTFDIHELPTFTLSVNGDMVANGGEVDVCIGDQVLVEVSDANVSGTFDMYLNDVLLVAGVPFDNGSFDFTASALDAGEYRFVLTSDNGSDPGCESEFIYTLNVNPLPSFTLEINGDEVVDGGEVTVCEGDMVNVTIVDANVTGTFDMYLDNDLLQSGLPFTNGSYPFEASLSDAGEYTFVVTSDDGCVTEFSYTLNVNPLPTFTLEINGGVIADGGEVTVCEGDLVNVEILDANVSGTYSMSLNGDLLQSDLPFENGSYSFNASLTDAGEYLFEVTSADGCTSEFTYTLIVNPLPAIAATVNGNAVADGGEVTVCDGDVVDVQFGVVNVTGTFDVYYDGGLVETLVDIADGYSFAASLTNGGEYSFVLVSSDGCESGFAFTLNVNTLPSFTLEVNGDEVADGGNVEVCEGGIVAISLEDLNVTGTFDIYYIDDVLAEDVPIEDGYVFNAASADAGTYTIIVRGSSEEDDLVCAKETSFTLTVNPSPAFTVEINDDVVNDGDALVVCEGALVNVVVSDLNVTATFDMYHNDDLVQSGLPFTNNSYPFIASLADAGTYRFVVTSSDNCTSEFNYQLTVNPLPVVADLNTSVCSDEGFSLTPVEDFIPDGTTYSWSAPDVTGGMTGGVAGTNETSIFGTLVNPTNVAQTATYTVTPEANGCAGETFTVVVTVEPTPVIDDMVTSTCTDGAFSVSPVNGIHGIVPAGITYFWDAPTNAGGAITGGVAGFGSSVNGVLANNTNVPQVAVYTVTPVIGNCSGETFTVSVTVYPKPVISSTAVAICTGDMFEIIPVDNSPLEIVPDGTLYTWGAPVVSDPGLTGGAAGGGFSITGTLTNTTNETQTAIYTVIPLSGTCVGTAFTVTVSVGPEVTVDAGADQAACANTDDIVLNGTVSDAGTEVEWSTSGDGSFDDATSLTAIYTPGAGDIANGSVKLTLTTTNPAPGCDPVSDEMVVTFYSIVVNNLDNAVNPVPGSLRQIINCTEPDGTVNFDASLLGATITLDGEEIVIDKNITIAGLGADDLRVSANGLSRVFRVTNNSTLTLVGITLSDGDINLLDGILIKTDSGSTLIIGSGDVRLE